jgi:hypothetical protein
VHAVVLHGFIANLEVVRPLRHHNGVPRHALDQNVMHVELQVRNQPGQSLIPFLCVGRVSAHAADGMDAVKCVPVLRGEGADDLVIAAGIDVGEGLADLAANNGVVHRALLC